jgi:hypothetical protein
MIIFIVQQNMKPCTYFNVTSTILGVDGDLAHFMLISGPEPNKLLELNFMLICSFGNAAKLP